MCSSEKPRILHYFGANKSVRIRTYRHPTRNPFRMRSYKKGGGGWGSEIETIPENHFRNQVIRRARYPNAQPKIHFPLRRQVQIDGRENLVLLFAQRQKLRSRTHRSVILNPSGNFFGEVVADFHIRRKDESIAHARAVKRFVKRGIKRQVPRPDLFIDNRAHLPGPGVHRKLAPLVADLVRQTQTHRPFPFRRYAHARPNVIPHPLHAKSIALVRENVKPNLEPVRNSVGNLNRFVLRVIGRQDAVLHRLAAVDGEIAVQLHHGVPRLNGVIRVYLNFVIILSPRQRRAHHQDRQKRPYIPAPSRSHPLPRAASQDSNAFISMPQILHGSSVFTFLNCSSRIHVVVTCTNETPPWWGSQVRGRVTSYSPRVSVPANSRSQGGQSRCVATVILEEDLSESR